MRREESETFTVTLKWKPQAKYLEEDLEKDGLTG